KAVSRRLGSSTLTLSRLFSRAPCTRIRSWPSAGCAGGCSVRLSASARLSDSARLSAVCVTGLDVTAPGGRPPRFARRRPVPPPPGPTSRRFFGGLRPEITEEPPTRDGDREDGGMPDPQGPVDATRVPRFAGPPTFA